MSNLLVKDYLANNGSVNEECNNFWDWFCSNSSLLNRGIALDKKVKALVKLGLIDEDKHKVLYKNNCPMDGKLYDSILVEDESGESVYWIVPASGHNSIKGEAEVYVYASKKEYKFSSWKGLKSALKENGLSVVGA